MKKLFYSVLILSLLSCSNDKPVVYSQGSNQQEQAQDESLSRIGNILIGEHRVKNIERKGDTISFLWENNDKEWTHSALPYTKVRYTHNPTSEPTIKFKWTYGYDVVLMEDIMENYVLYAVININE